MVPSQLRRKTSTILVETYMLEFYTKSELEKQRDYILGEFNFHEVFDICGDLYESDNRKQIINYLTVASLRAELTSVLDSYIASYLEDPSFGYRIYHNLKWDIGFSWDYDGKTPYLSASFRYEIASMDAGGMKRS